MRVSVIPAIFLMAMLVGIPGQAQRKSDCDPQKRPLVYVHGFLGSGDNWALQAQRLEANGYCPGQLFVFDWNSLNRQAPTDSLLHSFIKNVLSRTGALQVDLVGHSAGGGVCSRFLGRPDRASLVAHYVHIGSGPLPGPPGGVPTMNIFSTSDLVAGKAGPVPGALNVKQSKNDHLEVVTSGESFLSIFEFLVPSQKPHVYLRQAPSFEVSGRAVVLGENTPLPNARIEVWQHDTLTGKRIGKRPEWTARADSQGNWRGFRAMAGRAYEFVLRPEKGRVVHYFHEPFRYHDRLLYLRGLPSSGMAAMLLGGLPADTSGSALAIFTSNAAVITGRDTLSCNGRTLSTKELTPASKTCIALFLYDEGKDGVGTGKPMSLFGAAPFLNGADLLLPEKPGAPITVHYNGRTRRLPPIPSSEAVMVAVFK